MATAATNGVVPSLTAPAPGLAGLINQRTGGQLGGTSYANMIRALLGQGQAAGAFGPDFLRKFLRRRALQTSLNQRRAAGVSGQLFGLDPMQQRAALVNADIGAQGGLANSLNEADLQGAGNYQQLLQSLLGSERGHEFQAIEAKKERDANKGSFGGFLGQIAGSVIPGLIPTPKARQPKTYQPEDYYGPPQPGPYVGGYR